MSEVIRFCQVEDPGNHRGILQEQGDGSLTCEAHEFQAMAEDNLASIVERDLGVFSRQEYERTLTLLEKGLYAQAYGAAVEMRNALDNERKLAQRNRIRLPQWQVKTSKKARRQARREHDLTSFERVYAFVTTG